MVYCQVGEALWAWGKGRESKREKESIRERAHIQEQLLLKSCAQGVGREEGAVNPIREGVELTPVVGPWGLRPKPTVQ